MEKEKLLTIIIPIYNADAYLEECINSILISKSDLYEIILINDGSTDKSKRICEEYAKKNSKISLYNQKNQGVSTSRNHGIMKSISKYLMFVDADDVLKSEWDSIIDSLKEDDIYYFTNKIPDDIRKNELMTYIVGNNNQKICFAGPFSKVFKSEFLKNNDIKFNTGLMNGEDMLFNIECLLKTNKISIQNFSFYLYRNFIGSATKRFNSSIFKSDLTFQNEIANLLLNSSLSKREIENMILYCKQMAIFVFCQRISFLDKFKNAKQYYSHIFKEPYRKALYEPIIIDKKYALFIYLSRYKMFFLNYRILKIKKSIKTTRKNSFYFSEI